MLLVGAVMAVCPFLIGSGFSLVSDGTMAAPFHIKDTEGNPIENVEVYAFPQYGGDIPSYPSNGTPNVISNEFGNAEVILTTLNTVPVPSTSNSVTSMICFYHPSYKVFAASVPDWNYYTHYSTVLNGQTEPVTTFTFSETEDPEIETENPIEEIQFDEEYSGAKVIAPTDEEPRVLSNSISLPMVVCGLVVVLIGCVFAGYGKYRE